MCVQNGICDCGFQVIVFQISWFNELSLLLCGKVVFHLSEILPLTTETFVRILGSISRGEIRRNYIKCAKE